MIPELEPVKPECHGPVEPGTVDALPSAGPGAGQVGGPPARRSGARTGKLLASFRPRELIWSKVD